MNSIDNQYSNENSDDLNLNIIPINLENLELTSNCSSPTNSLDLNYPEIDNSIVEEINEKLSKKEELFRESVEKLEKLLKNKDGENIADILTNLCNILKKN